MKDFFFYSKSQRAGIIVLLIILLLVLAADCYLSFVVVEYENIDAELAESFQKEIALFNESLKEAKKRQNTNNNFEQSSSYNQTPSQQKKYSLFEFDPNTADSADFVQLGLSARIAHNILKYRSKGGFFKTPEHFGQTYGITEQKFAELAPYIVIVEKEKPAPVSRDTIFITKQLKKDTILELNTADTTELMLIRGIGRGYANAIVKYRQQLGGYYSVQQLLELPSMTEENYLYIKDAFVVDSSLIRTIVVNKASVDQLEEHPYLKFTQAKAIYELRRLKFSLNNIQQIADLDELTDADIARLMPYLSFEKKQR